MNKHYNLISCMLPLALSLSACGPLSEDEQSALDGVSTVNEAKIKRPAVTEFGTAESSDTETIGKMTLVGDLGSAMGNPVATYANTCAASNQWATTCGSGSSRDIAYVWRVPETGTYSFTSRNSSFDTVIEVRNYRATSQVLGCNDDYAGQVQGGFTLNSLAKGTQLLIIIEGYEGECGAANLNIIKR